MDLSKVQVPVQKTVDEEDEQTGLHSYRTVTEYEPINPGGKQSDGSMWTVPEPLTPEDHEHFFALQDPSQRSVVCECGFGGDVFPHNAVIKDGHIFDLAGNKVA